MEGRGGSSDCGVTFENLGRIGVGQNLYDVTFDSANPKRMAVAGWSIGVAISDDQGATWQLRNAGLPRTDVVTIVFDPVNRGRMYASVHEAGLYRSDDEGRNWKLSGPQNTAVSRMKFIPDTGSK